jgi:predicted RNase H-like HicB family nuclease
VVLDHPSGEAEMKYTAIIEPTGTGFSAYLPDLPGCIATGGTIDATRRSLREAVNAHVALLREYGQPVPVVEAIAFEISRPSARRTA